MKSIHTLLYISFKDLLLTLSSSHFLHVSACPEATNFVDISPFPLQVLFLILPENLVLKRMNWYSEVLLGL